VNLAVVGLGYWGPNLLRALFELEGVRVGYVCDLDESRLNRIANRYAISATTA
jgi:predicted dehydrogenase